MGRVSITEENRTGQGGDRFPQLKLVTNERARFFIFEQPWSEWVHELKAPKIEGGVPVMEVREKKDKSTYEVVKQDFLRRSICLGNTDVMKDKGLDPDNCPACQASLDSGGDVPRPVQRFAAPVIRYKLRGSTWSVQDPFSAEILIWPITARMWDSIVELQGKIGDLRKHDLTLECEDGGWQRNKLSFEMDAAYLASDATKVYIKQLLGAPGNRPTDDQLRDACGGVATRSYLEQDINVILGRWRMVHDAGPAGSSVLQQQSGPAPTAVDLGAGLDALLGGVTEELAGTPYAPGAPQSAQPVQQAYDAAQHLTDMLETGDPLGLPPASGAAPASPAPAPAASAPAAPASQPAPAAAPATPPASSPSSGDLDFETLLGI